MADWEEFLKRYYWESILGLAHDYPDRKTISIDFYDVERYNLDAAAALLDKPDSVLPAIEKALRNIDLPADIESWLPVVKITNLPGSEHVKIRDIRCEHINKLITVHGLVQKTSEVRPRIINAAFMCKRCERITFLMQPEIGFIEPFECDNEVCGRRGPFRLLKDRSEFINAQKVRIQESPEDLRGGEPPQTLDISIEGELTGTVLPGNRITITGIPRGYQRTTNTGKTSQFDIIFQALDISICENDMDIVITADDEQKIRELALSLDVIDKLVGSFAPSIYGYSAIKEAILACAVSGENNILPDGTMQRGDAHMLICGDPGTAKSTLLLFTHKLVPRSQFATGDGSTRAGLTASVVKDDFYGSRWCLEAGTLVLADRSLALIDELDKMRQEDIPKLNTALSSGTIPVNKAGINCLLWAREPVIAAMNPKEGRFNMYDPLAGQVNIRSDTLSRFDLIFLMKDVPDKEIDNRISETLVNAWCNGSGSADTDLLRKYLAKARQVRNVTLTNEAQEHIKRYYRQMRGKYRGEADAIPITSRSLEALIRLTRAEAKLRFSSTADVRDAIRAVRLIEASFQEVCVDERGRIDADTIEIGAGKSQRDAVREVIKVIRDLQDGTGAKYGDIALKAVDLGIEKDRFDFILSMLKTRGDVYESRTGYWRAV